MKTFQIFAGITLGFLVAAPGSDPSDPGRPIPTDRQAWRKEGNLSQFAVASEQFMRWNQNHT